MRILIATPYLPWPLDSGGNAAQFSTLKCLAQDHQFTLVAPVYDESGLANARELQARLPQVQVRPVDCGAPPLPRPGVWIRVGRQVVGWGRRLLSPPPQPASQAAGAGALVYPFDPLPEPLIAALQDELAKGADLFQAEFAQMLPLAAWLPKEVPSLFVHHQIHFVYARRFLETHGGGVYLQYLQRMMQTQELAYLEKFQGVVVFSDYDRQALLPYQADEKLFTSPFPLPTDIGIADELPAAFDGRFLFLASEAHGPNREALEWLLATIWGEILRALPAARLLVIGQWSERAQARFAAPGVAFAGFVNDLPTTLRGGIMLVPLRIGSGLRVKIMAAMAQGVPVVSTTVGYEGLLVRNEKDLLVRDDPLEFAAAAIQLAQDPELWQCLAAAGRSAISQHYSPARVRQRRNEIYATVAGQASWVTPTPDGATGE